MQSLRRVLTAIAVPAMITGLMLSGSSPASAEPRDGRCDPGEFCYFFNSNQQGAIADLPPSMGDYGAKQPSCFEFRGEGQGRGECVKNHAASVWNRTDQPVRVHFGSNFGGDSQTFAPDERGNLKRGLKNENASHTTGGGANPAPPQGPGQGQGNTFTAYVTAYVWHDNDPPGPDIAFPGFHQSAGGRGTFDDPITLAVGYSRSSGRDVLDYPKGTRFYIPDMQRYFIVEDKCGACHSRKPSVDMWIDGRDSKDLANQCMAKVSGRKTVIVNPHPNYVVSRGNGVIHDGICDHGHGNTPVTR